MAGWELRLFVGILPVAADEAMNISSSDESTSTTYTLFSLALELFRDGGSGLAFFAKSYCKSISPFLSFNILLTCLDLKTP